MRDPVYFAQLDGDNIVVGVHILNYKNCCDYLGNKSESIGVGYCQQRYGSNTIWKETFKTGVRGNFAGTGYRYDEDLDAFIPPQPFTSWTLDTNTFNWVSPLGAAPDLTDAEIEANKYYVWDEDSYQADNTTGWIFPPTVL